MKGFLGGWTLVMKSIGLVRQRATKGKNKLGVLTLFTLDDGCSV